MVLGGWCIVGIGLHACCPFNKSSLYFSAEPLTSLCYKYVRTYVRILFLAVYAQARVHLSLSLALTMVILASVPESYIAYDKLPAESLKGVQALHDSQVHDSLESAVKEWCGKDLGEPTILLAYQQVAQGQSLGLATLKGVESLYEYQVASGKFSLGALVRKDGLGQRATLGGDT